MLRFLSTVLALAIAVIVISFTLSNRQVVTVGLWPLPFTQDLPLWLLTLGLTTVGFLIGGFVSFVASWPMRARRRRAEREAETLRVSLQMAEDRAAAAEKELTRTKIAARAPVATTMASAPAASGPRMLGTPALGGTGASTIAGLPAVSGQSTLPAVR